MRYLEYILNELNLQCNLCNLKHMRLEYCQIIEKVLK